MFSVVAFRGVGSFKLGSCRFIILDSVILQGTSMALKIWFRTMVKTSSAEPWWNTSHDALRFTLQSGPVLGENHGHFGLSRGTCSRKLCAAASRRRNAAWQLHWAWNLLTWMSSAMTYVAKSPLVSISSLLAPSSSALFPRKDKGVSFPLSCRISVVRGVLDFELKVWLFPF